MPNTSSTQALTKDWYTQLEAQSAASFINLPIEFQLRDYSYGNIAKSYLNFFQSETNKRSEKLTLARKFLKFIRSINKNRAREELNEDFFKCFEYFMENFKDLTSKQDMIHLETLSVITEAIDRSQFVEDIINVDELQRRVAAVEKAHKKEEIITVNFADFEAEYKQLNNTPDRDKYLLNGSPST